ncbi:hypothetical protein DFJ63DRAFT_333071 [Scheffersomyces coipomensis]|uniref:uncharacterized protein n=1 Tax=Scheffersomyces coipomensis TaxID=1788519 RepID=UPI00315DED60
MSSPSVVDYIYEFVTSKSGSNSEDYVRVIASALILISVTIYFQFNKVKKPTPTSSPIEKKGGFYPTEPYKPLEIKPVSSTFQWDKDPPLKSYPFKNAEYKLTMGIKTLDPQDWLLIEPTYLDRVNTKTKLIHNSHESYPKDKDIRASTLFMTEEAVPATRELYNLIINYMVDKYPMYFKKVDNHQIHNLITDKFLPQTSEGVDPEKCLEYLVKNIEEDVIILLKDPTREHEKDGSEYFFKAGIFAFAAGFDPADRFNKPLSYVHHPIPGYEEKLKLSMNRGFNRLAPGQFITRNNFSIQSHDLFYVDDRNKGHNRPVDFVPTPLKVDDLDFDNQVHYRSERQCLTKLPESGAIIFTIRTYLLPLSQVKHESTEVRERLIGAIKGLPEDIAKYKNAVEWGPAVLEYLQRDD